MFVDVRRSVKTLTVSKQILLHPTVRSIDFVEHLVGASSNVRVGDTVVDEPVTGTRLTQLYRATGARAMSIASARLAAQRWHILLSTAVKLHLTHYVPLGPHTIQKKFSGSATRVTMWPIKAASGTSEPSKLQAWET